MYSEVWQTEEKKQKRKWRATPWSFPAGALAIATWVNMDKKSEKQGHHLENLW